MEFLIRRLRSRLAASSDSERGHVPLTPAGLDRALVDLIAENRRRRSRCRIDRPARDDVKFADLIRSHDVRSGVALHHTHTDWESVAV